MHYLALLFALISFGVYSQDSDYSATVQATYGEAMLAYSNQNFTEAKSRFSDCIEQNSNCFEAYLGLGQIHFIEKNYADALSTCKKGEKIRPFNPDIYSLMGRSHFWLKEYKQAEFFLKRSLSLNNEQDEDNLFLALSLQKSANYKESIYYFDQAISAEPEKASIWLLRGDLHSEMESYEKAQIDFERALKLSPKNAKVCTRLAEALIAQNKDKKANEYIELGMTNANDSEQVSLLLLRGHYHQKNGDYTKALEIYASAFNLEPANSTILIYQASALIDTENYEAAIQKCDAAIILNSEQKEAYFNRGIAREMVRDLDGACADWQKAFILGSQRAIEYLNGPVCSE